MSVQYPKVGPWAEERNKWEQHFSAAISSKDEDGGAEIPVGNPYQFRPYPRMLYKARRTEDGRLLCIDPYNEQWSRGNYTIVGNADWSADANRREHDKSRDQGWFDTQQEAIAHVHGLEKDVSDAHAYREYSDRNMSEKAKAEAQAVEAGTGLHVPEIPEAPRVKRKYQRRKPVIQES